jgi:hypothetical protein
MNDAWFSEPVMLQLSHGRAREVASSFEAL